MSLSSGSRLGSYEVVALLGEGGMGQVYRARDTRLNRTVAIKVLSPGIAAAPGFRERFAREARSLSAIEHPHICALYDIGREGDVDFLVMQYIDGDTLAERIARGPIPLNEALVLAAQIAAGLEAAHERGILHRDLKPSNIKLAADGHAKLVDFGLAKTLAAAGASDGTDASAIATTLSEPGLVLGSPGYMSPEQAMGKAVDRRTDVWAFGCVLYEMLTGRRAFGGGDVASTLAAVVASEPDWSRLPASTPARVRTLLRRCLSKDPSLRLRDMGDVRLELIDEEAEPAAPAGATTGRRGTATLAWSLAGIATLIAIGALLIRPHGDGSREAIRFSVVTNFSGIESQPALSPDGRSIVFVSNPGGQWDLHVALVAGGTAVRITNDPEIEGRPQWSPDGTHILFSRMNERGLTDLWVAPALGGPGRRIVENGSQPSWSPDGRSIAYTATGAIWICDSKGDNPRAVTRPELPLEHHQPAFSRDGRKLAFILRSTGPRGELTLLNLETGKITQLTDDGALAWSPVWSPDDKFIYFTSSRGGTMNVWKIPAASGRPEQITAGQGADIEIDLSADGKRLVYSSIRINVNLAEISLEPGTLGRRTLLTSDAARQELAPQYSPDGRRIAYLTNRTGAEREVVWAMDANGDNPVKIVEDDYTNVFPYWTPDGEHLVYFRRGGNPLARAKSMRHDHGLWQASLAGGTPQELPVAPWRSHWGDVGLDGRLVVQTSPDSGIVFDPRTGQRRAVAELPGAPSWSPDGHSIAFAVRPGVGKDSDEGLWVGDPFGDRRQVFRGWVVWFAWAGADEILALEGKPDFRGVLWRVATNGRREVALPEMVMYRRDFDSLISPVRFDVHPDGRRIVSEVFETLEADIGMIENVR
jgi:Tol biopolymer transport system component